MTATAEVAADGHVVLVRSTKSLIVLAVHEILEVLKHDPELWARALRRGKFERRSAAARRMEGRR